jgi:hypothetical protein
MHQKPMIAKTIPDTHTKLSKKYGVKFKALRKSSELGYITGSATNL